MLEGAEPAVEEVCGAMPVATPASTDAARREQVECFRINTSLEQIRQLGRPGMLTLRDPTDRPVYVLLTALDDRSATLRVGNAVQTVSLRSLASGWRGEFATFWRVPPGYNAASIDAPSPPMAEWLADKLKAIDPQAVGPLKSRISAFQAVHGLKPDGIAGPATVMRINRAIGIDEPRLAAVDAASTR
jgi:general secretion pathway protein A